jgi:hypothetical protein
LPRVTGRFPQNCSPDTIFCVGKKTEPHFFVDRGRFPFYDQEWRVIGSIALMSSAPASSNVCHIRHEALPPVVALAPVYCGPLLYRRMS